MEKLLWEVPGVEYVYSTSSPGLSMVIVRFRVGRAGRAGARPAEPEARRQLRPHPARRVDAAREAALDRRRADHGADALERPLRRLPAAADRRPAARRHQGSDRRLGGRDHRRPDAPGQRRGRPGAPRVLRPRPARRCRRHPGRQRAPAGVRRRRGQPEPAGAGRRLARRVPTTCSGVVVGRAAAASRSSSRDVADRPRRRRRAVHLRHLPGQRTAGPTRPSRSRSPSARAPTRSTSRAGSTQTVERLRGTLLPADVHVTVTRNYGETAEHKSNELLWHMFLAVFSVSILIWLTLGRREAAVVLVAIPVTLALTLFVFYLYGYTLNRITLFALIFSIGILVDDAIVVVENIVRHARLGDGRESGGLARGGREGRGRGRQPDDPRDAHRRRRHPADGLRRRPDGPLHAAHPGRRDGRDAVLAGRRVRRHAVGRRPAAEEARAAHAHGGEDRLTGALPHA